MIDNKIISWIEKRLELVEWIIAAEERMQNGHVSLYYQDGKLIGCDICMRERKNLQKTIDKQRKNGIIDLKIL